MRKFAFASLALIGLAGAPATSATLQGTFSGRVASGVYSQDVFQSGTTVREVVGGTWIGIFNIDEYEGFFSGDQGASLIFADSTNPDERGSTGTGGFAFPYDSLFRYKDGRVTIQLRLQSNGPNAGGDLTLVADVVDRQLTNWRGTIQEGGQIDTFISYDFEGNLTDIQFSGSYTGLTQVPEPSSWLMMILGFGLCGAAARFGKTEFAERTSAV